MLVRRRPHPRGPSLLIAVSACGCTATAPSAAPTAAPAATLPDEPTAASTPLELSLEPLALRASKARSCSRTRAGLQHSPDLARERRRLERPAGVSRTTRSTPAPSLSPDGTRIVFGRILTDTIEAAVADPSLFGAVTLINVDGSGLHEIDTGDRAKLCDEAPEGDAWSPDGSRIAYVRFCFDKKAQFVEAGIWTMKADGTDARQVTKLPATRTSRTIGSAGPRMGSRSSSNGSTPRSPRSARRSSRSGPMARACSRSRRGRSTATTRTGRPTAR